jgi:hypothetical protein
MLAAFYFQSEIRQLKTGMVRSRKLASCFSLKAGVNPMLTRILPTLRIAGFIAAGILYTAGVMMLVLMFPFAFIRLNRRHAGADKVIPSITPQLVRFADDSQEFANYSRATAV